MPDSTSATPQRPAEKSNAAFEKQLNELGAQGWQVVGITTKKQLLIAPPQAIILMREVKPTGDASATASLVQMLGDGGRAGRFGSITWTNQGSFETTSCPWKSRSKSARRKPRSRASFAMPRCTSEVGEHALCRVAVAREVDEVEAELARELRRRSPTAHAGVVVVEMCSAGRGRCPSHELHRRETGRTGC
jgi:hypothetical protein